MLVSIIVPAFKQESTIKKDITNICNVMRQTRWEFEILVVVDGFLDKTYEEAKELENEFIKVYGYKNNRGKGFAVRYGMSRSRGEYVAFIDAGMEIDANGVSMILEHMEWYKADIIVGSKRHPASRVSYPLLRRIYSIGYQFLTFILFRLNVRDTQTGLKVYRRNVLEDVLPRLVIKEYAFDIELLSVSNYLGYKRIFEAPVVVSWNFASGSRFKHLFFLDPFIRNMLQNTLGVFYRMYILKYYDSGNKRKWKYDEELEMRINTGGM